MEKNCKICNRDFSRPYNLRRHYQEFHPLETQPKRLRMGRIVRPQNPAVGSRGNDSTSKLERQGTSTLRRTNGFEDVSMEQYGGRVHESDDMESEDDEDGDSMNNNIGSASESDTESDTSVDSVDDGDDPDWVFDSIIEEAEERLGKDATYENLQIEFRHLLLDKIEWCHHFRKHPTYKKIMETARELQDGPEDFDREEALSVAVLRRQFLINRLVPEPDDEDEQSEPGDDDDSDSIQEDDIQV